ncbi:ATP-grasp domain-containing protein [Paenibacillus rhizoplanae]|uniref:ATP-grasp domain-containing protein n=1 Tax=Paenibacillus rhizoplanae TaxID=1917181 RepID=A0ABW5FK37_9BACL
MSDLISLIHELWLNSKQISKKYNVALITNTRSQTREINGQPVNYSLSNEFFSDEEYDEVFEGIKRTGFFVETFFNEPEFIMTVLREAYYKNKRLVYNLARNGEYVGKKSLIPSFCDLLHIPYTGADAFVISLSRAKYTYTKFLESHNILVPDSWVLSPTGWLDKRPPDGKKIIIKPLYESASIGLGSESIIEFNSKKALELHDLSYSSNKSLLIQEFIEGYECEVPLLISSTPFAFEPVGISINDKRLLNEAIITFDHSYNDSYDFYSLNEELPKSIIEKTKESAKIISNLVGLRNYGRIDFRINNNGIPYLMDIAASPYTTNHSSFSFAFAKLGFETKHIYSSIIALATNV